MFREILKMLFRSHTSGDAFLALGIEPLVKIDIAVSSPLLVTKTRNGEGFTGDTFLFINGRPIYFLTQFA